MDFTFNDEQTAVREAAGGSSSGLVDPDRVARGRGHRRPGRPGAVGRAGQADLLGLAVPAADGGGGYGMVELCLLLEAQGQVVAPVPLWATLVLGALPVAEFGADGLRAALLPGVAAGDVVLTAALADVADDIAVGGPGRPSVQATVGRGRDPHPERHRPRRPLRPRGRPGARPGGDPGRRGRGRGRPGGRRRDGRAGRDHQPRDPPPPPPRRCGRRPPATCSPGATAPRREVRDLDARTGLDRAVRPAARASPRRPSRQTADVPERPPAVRTPAGHLPGAPRCGPPTPPSTPRRSG